MATTIEAEIVESTPIECSIIAKDLTKPYIDVRKYGTTGKGIADDTVALKAAYAAASAANKPMHIPAGTYLFTSQLTWDSEKVNVYGDGIQSSVLMKSGNFDGIKIIGFEARFERFQVNSAGGADASVGIEGSWIARCTFQDVYIINQGSHGLHDKGGNGAVFINVVSDGNGGDGIKLEGQTGHYPTETCNANTFINTRANSNGGYGLNLDDSDSNFILSLTAHANENYGLRVNDNVSLIYCYLEGNLAEEKTITGATKTNPVVITCEGHGFVDGHEVTIDDVAGMTELNENSYTVNVLTADTFDIGVDGSGYTTYVSSGEAHRTGNYTGAIVESGAGDNQIYTPTKDIVYDLGNQTTLFDFQAGPNIKAGISTNNDVTLTPSGTGYVTAINRFRVKFPGVGVARFAARSDSKTATNEIAHFQMQALDDGDNETLYANIVGVIVDPTDGAEVGQIKFAMVRRGTVMTIKDTNVGIGTATPSIHADLTLENGELCIKETTTPTADANYGKIYTKNDNKLYFQDGDGNEHEIEYV